MSHTITFSVTVTVDTDDSETAINAEMALSAELDDAVQSWADDPEVCAEVLTHEVSCLTTTQDAN